MMRFIHFIFKALVMKEFIWNKYPPVHVKLYLMIIQLSHVGAIRLGIPPAISSNTSRMLSSAEKSEVSQEKNMFASDAPANAVTYGQFDYTNG
jgi:hypothetical protein